MENETLLQKIRESKVQGPFEIDTKESLSLYNNRLGFLTPLLKRWKRKEEKFFQSAQDVADYLERRYLGIGKLRGWYHWKLVSERKGLRGRRVLKLRDIPHIDSESIKHNYPEHYVWLRVRPLF